MLNKEQLQTHDLKYKVLNQSKTYWNDAVSASWTDALSGGTKWKMPLESSCAVMTTVKLDVTITSPAQCQHCLLIVNGKGSPYSITERRVLELIPVLGSEPAGDVSHKPGGRLPLLSARPAVTPATLKRAATSFAAWWTEAQWVWAVCLLMDQIKLSQLTVTHLQTMLFGSMSIHHFSWPTDGTWCRPHGRPVQVARPALRWLYRSSHWRPLDTWCQPWTQ